MHCAAGRAAWQVSHAIQQQRRRAQAQRKAKGLCYITVLSSAAARSPLCLYRRRLLMRSVLAPQAELHGGKDLRY
jgi:hypothetical protein